MKPRKRELQKALDDVLDVAIWMSGSSSFSPEGEAHAGWVKMRDEKLYPALAVSQRAASPVPLSHEGDET